MIRTYLINAQHSKTNLLKAPSVSIRSSFKQMRIYILAFFLICISISGIAQRQFDPQTLELIKTKKIAFLTEQIGLTSKEAEKFWPIYNELDKERSLLMDKKRELEHSSDTPNGGMTEADYRKLAIELASAHSREGKLIEEYNLKLLNILPAEKVVKLYLAEGKFRATLMQEFRRSRDEKKDNQPKN